MGVRVGAVQPVALKAQKHVHDRLQAVHFLNDRVPIAGGVKRLRVLLLQGLDAVEHVLREAGEGAGAVLSVVYQVVVEPLRGVWRGLWGRGGEWLVAAEEGFRGEGWLTSSRDYVCGLLGREA